MHVVFSLRIFALFPAYVCIVVFFFSFFALDSGAPVLAETGPGAGKMPKICKTHCVLHILRAALAQAGWGPAPLFEICETQCVLHFLEYYLHFSSHATAGAGNMQKILKKYAKHSVLHILGAALAQAG